MIEGIRVLMKANPFQPFTILTSGGNEYPVLTPDHADISPKGGRVAVWFDDDSSISIAGLHIVAIRRGSGEKAGTS